jgi:hypothetical protein
MSGSLSRGPKSWYPHIENRDPPYAYQGHLNSRSHKSGGPGGGPNGGAPHGHIGRPKMGAQTNQGPKSGDLIGGPKRGCGGALIGGPKSRCPTWPHRGPQNGGPNKSGSQIGVPNRGPKSGSQIGVPNWGPKSGSQIGVPNRGPGPKRGPNTRSQIGVPGRRPRPRPR